jgi:predicted ATPase
VRPRARRSLNAISVDAKPNSEGLRALEERCARIKETLAEFASPWVVEFAGLPRAGKSGCIASIEHLLRRNGLSVLTPSEGAGRAPEHLKSDLVAYNAWTATYAIQQILEGSVRSARDPSRQYEIVLLDRGLFDAAAWLHLFESRGQLEEGYRKTCTEFLRLQKWSALVRQVFVFFCSPAEALRRELHGKLSDKAGIVVSEAFLNELRPANEQACERYGDAFEIATVQTDGADVQTVAYAVAQHIFEAIDRARP